MFTNASQKGQNPESIHKKSSFIHLLHTFIHIYSIYSGNKTELHQIKSFFFAKLFTYFSTCPTMMSPFGEGKLELAVHALSCFRIRYPCRLFQPQT